MTAATATNQPRAASRVRLCTWDEELVTATARELRAETGGATLAVLFVSPEWRPRLAEMIEIIQVEGHVAQVVGCSADGLIGTGREHEDASGFSLMFLNLPGADVKAWVIDEQFHIPQDRPRDGAWLLLGNPLRVNAQAFLEDMNRLYPGAPVYGGLAGGGWDSEKLFVFHNEDPSGESAGVAVHFSGVKIGGLVSQGCEPIGEAFTITKVADDMVLGVGGRRAYDVLVETFESLPEREQKLARGNIMAGLAANEYVEEFRRGDFVVRNILGGDPKSGALKIGAIPRVGQTIQFQLREKDAADEDLRQRCEDLAREGGRPLAALLFTCGGRGRHLFDVPDHDAGLVHEILDGPPAAGFFCNGEFGPVAGVNFLHGYTASLMAFY